MPNWFLKLACLLVAAAAAFAAEHFGLVWPFIITALALHRYYVIETLEMVVIGCQAAIHAEMFEQAVIDQADERDFISDRPVLDSATFRDRLHRFGDN